MRITGLFSAIILTIATAACDKSPTSLRLDPLSSPDCPHFLPHVAAAPGAQYSMIMNHCWRQAITLPFSAVTDINESGQVLGTLTDAGGNTTMAVWTAGVLRPLQAPGIALDMNNNGEAVGFVFGIDRFESVYWDAAGVRHHLYFGGDARGINDAGTIVGRLTGQAFVRLADTTRIVPVTAAISAANAINNSGQVVGTYSDDLERPDLHAYIWTQSGGAQQLAIPEDAVPRSILDDGTVYGTNAAGLPFKWTQTGGYVALQPAAYAGIDSFPGTPRIANTFSETLGLARRDNVFAAVTWTPDHGVTELRVNGLQVESEPFAINSASDVIGTYRGADGVSHTVLWTWTPTKYGVATQTFGPVAAGTR